jgi:hypothetical protein
MSTPSSASRTTASIFRFYLVAQCWFFGLRLSRAFGGEQSADYQRTKRDPDLESTDEEWHLNGSIRWDLKQIFHQRSLLLYAESVQGVYYTSNSASNTFDSLIYNIEH